MWSIGMAPACGHPPSAICSLGLVLVVQIVLPVRRESDKRPDYRDHRQDDADPRGPLHARSAFLDPLEVQEAEDQRRDAADEGCPVEAPATAAAAGEDAEGEREPPE